MTPSHEEVWCSAQRDNGSRLHLARSASTNVIIYASLIISSKVGAD